MNYDNLMFKIQTLEIDLYIYKLMIIEKDKIIKNLRTRYKRLKKEYDLLEDKFNKQFTIFDYDL